jgi:hypothetical protein
MDKRQQAFLDPVPANVATDVKVPQRLHPRIQPENVIFKADTRLRRQTKRDPADLEEDVQEEVPCGGSLEEAGPLGPEATPEAGEHEPQEDSRIKLEAEGND